MARSVHTSLRIDGELADWFNEQFPWRGSLPEFVNAALAAFKEEWGERQPPQQVVEKAMAKLAPKY